MNRRGFTLIELLVVIVIIGVLAGLIVPAVNKALVQARFAGSQSNLRQIGVALLLFSQENNGNFPTASDSIPYNKNWESVPPADRSWQMQLIPFTGGDEKIFFSSYAAGFNANAKKWSYFLGSHAAGKEAMDNGTFDLANPPSLNLNKMKAQSKHILAGEDHRGAMMLQDSDKDDYSSNNPAFGYAGADRKVNVLFADGHVESHKRFDRNKMAVTYGGIDATYTGYE
jgi:prepilin-type N-terminal cleavage/methylation domain-containing protein/prepilin-type processing-associated H-X9-DG protein